MKRLIQTLLVGALIGSVGVTALMADVKKGQKHYLKSFKSKFHMNGTKFAALHTQDEWTELFKNEGEGFIKAFTERFPNAQNTLAKPKVWKKLEHVKDFAIEYANDSGNVPSCG